MGQEGRASLGESLDCGWSLNLKDDRNSPWKVTELVKKELEDLVVSKYLCTKMGLLLFSPPQKTVYI